LQAAYRRLSLSSELQIRSSEPDRECALIGHSIVNEFGADKSRAVAFSRPTVTARLVALPAISEHVCRISNLLESISIVRVSR
jgi:hypothetical protein